MGIEAKEDEQSSDQGGACWSALSAEAGAEMEQQRQGEQYGVVLLVGEDERNAGQQVAHLPGPVCSGRGGSEGCGAQEPQHGQDQYQACGQQRSGQGCGFQRKHAPCQRNAVIVHRAVAEIRRYHAPKGHEIRLLIIQLMLLLPGIEQGPARAEQLLLKGAPDEGDGKRP